MIFKKESVMVEIENYIDSFTKTTQKKLRKVYPKTRSAAVDAEESINYGMLVLEFKNKPLVYLAGYKNQIGF